MKTIHIILLMIGVLPFACQTEDKPSSVEKKNITPKAPLKGKWEAVSFIMNGDEMLGEAIKYNAYEFKDYGEMTTYTDGRTVDMTYRMKDNKMQLFGDNGSLNVDITRLTQEELVLNYDTGRFKVTAKFER